MTSTKNTTKPARLLALLVVLAITTSTAACISEPVEYFTPPPSTPTPTPVVEGPEVFERPDIRTIAVPQYPQAANEISEDGARAFAYYFLEVLNYTAATGNTELLQSISGPECNFCQKAVEFTKQLNEYGEWTEGYEIKFKAEPTLLAEKGVAFVFDIALDSAAYNSYNSEGETASYGATELVGLIAVYRLDNYWLVEDMGQRAES